MNTTPNALTVQDDKPKKAPLVAGGGLSAIVPQNVEQAFRMAQMICVSGIAPRDMKTPEAVVTSIMAGMEVGLLPMQAVQSIAVVNGRPTIWGDAALGLVMASGLCEDFSETVEGQGDQMVATCTARRVGMKSPSVQRFSVQDAKDAGLWGKQGPWKQYPRRMLAMRARAFALRNLFPDVLKGLGVREEVHDYSGPTSDRIASRESTGTAAALAAQAGAAQPAAEHDDDGVIDVEGETIEDTQDRGEQVQGQDAVTESEDDAPEHDRSTPEYWVKAINQGMTVQAVESTYAMWQQHHFADFAPADRKAVTVAKNQRVFSLKSQG